MTFLFDPPTAIKSLHALEEQWGGNAIDRMAAKYTAAERDPAASTAKPVTEGQVEEAVQKADGPSAVPTAAQTGVVVPPPETGTPVTAPVAGATAVPSPVAT
jgi:hypothetical protein